MATSLYCGCSTHHLWTDATARHFIQTHYPSFLATYDSYEYNIQRADAIRYFVLHRYGGIYMDLDVSTFCLLCPAHELVRSTHQTHLRLRRLVSFGTRRRYCAETGMLFWPRLFL